MSLLLGRKRPTGETGEVRTVSETKPKKHGWLKALLIVLVIAAIGGRGVCLLCVCQNGYSFRFMHGELQMGGCGRDLSCT